MALCNICIDLQGGRKCRKIAWSNRGPHIPVGYAGTQAQGGETIGWDAALIKRVSIPSYRPWRWIPASMPV